jgi:lipoic acid synthetase
VIGVRMPGRLSDRHDVKVRLRKAGLHTVCEEAHCPNMAECFGADTATFMILGEVCTRRCRFCAVVKDREPAPPDPDEPRRVAECVSQLGLSHAVVTSVTRDDLPDGGAAVFAECVRQIRKHCPETTVELLVPDFEGDRRSLKLVLDSRPEVLNHNVECVPRLYPQVRPQADFARSLTVLRRAADSRGVVAKSGLMVGLGETDEEVLEVLSRLRAAGCRAVVIGQYLQPTRENLPVSRRVAAGQFEEYRRAGEEMGLVVLSGQLVRSSYRAREVYSSLV